jgi:hypothetical protein
MPRDPWQVAEGRHLATRQIARWFAYGHLSSDHVRTASKACSDLAAEMIDYLPDGPELLAGLRKLLEAKDCFVRAAIGGEE